MIELKYGISLSEVEIKRIIKRVFNEFVEAEHPRDEQGKFTEKAGKDFKKRISELEKERESSNVGKNLYGNNIDEFVKNDLLEQHKQELSKETIEDQEVLEDWAHSLEEINQDIEDGFGDQYGRTTPFENEEQANEALRAELLMKYDVENDYNELSSDDWARYREKFSSQSSRDDFFEKYQDLARDILEDAGYNVVDSKSRISDSKYLYVYDNEDKEVAKIRISDHDTHKNYGEDINLYTTKNIEKEFEKLEQFLKSEVKRK